MNGQRSADYNVYSTFQSHEPEFDYLKSLEIEEKINKIRWLKQCNSAHFLLSTNGNLHLLLLWINCSNWLFKFQYAVAICNSSEVIVTDHLLILFFISLLMGHFL